MKTAREILPAESPLARDAILLTLQRVEQVETREQLIAELDALLALMVEHFAAEESPGGPFERAQDVEEAERVDELRSEHAAIVAMVRAELLELHAEFDGVWKEHRAVLDDLVRRVRRHEATEAALLSLLEAE